MPLEDSTTRSFERMREHAVDIFKAGLEPVMPDVAVKRFCRLDGSRFIVGNPVPAPAFSLLAMLKTCWVNCLLFR